MNTTRLHSSAENLSKDYLSPYRVPSTPMTSIGTQELPIEELNYETLLNLLNEFQSGVIRKPDHFNNLHFLIFLLYDSHGYTRDRYPLWRWYHRIKKKLLTAKHLTIDNEQTREHILLAIDQFIEKSSTIVMNLIEERVQVEHHYLQTPIYGLFSSYSILHTYLYIEQIDKVILNENSKLFQLIQSAFLKSYRNDHCDLIHFAIAHKKTNLLTKIFDENTNWLDLSIDLVTDRGWLPLHYAAYVGDKEMVKSICEHMTSLNFGNEFDNLSLLIPKFKQTQFENSPHDYILKACGVERDNHQTRQHQNTLLASDYSHPFNDQTRTKRQEELQDKFRSNIEGQLARDQPSLGLLIQQSNSNSMTINNDNDIPDADELELSSLPLIQREEFIDKILHHQETKPMLVPSPLILACLATCGEKGDYEDIVKYLLESHLIEYDGLNHECILNRVLNYMHRKDYAAFQHVQVYRETETEGPSSLIFYQFDGFIVNQDVRPVSGAFSSSSVTLNTSKNDESVASDDGYLNETPISVRCFLTILVLRDVFAHYPRWDFHVLRETIEEHFAELENALGCRPTILYPDGDIISSRKRSDVTWEVIVRYRLSTESGQSLYMQVDYYFFESFGDPLADAFANIYQTPFYVSCMTDSTVMMDTIFDAYFKRRHLHCWGTVAEKHLEHCFDGILQIKNNFTTFLALCTTLHRYYQVDGDPFIEENSATIQRIFVHAFACCVRRNAKIELDYLIKNHALIYYDSCRTKPSDIRHNILTYCVVRNLANVFDQLMTNMKTTMYKTYQNSTNPDWQPHIAWREIIHVIIDPVSQQTNESNDFTQLACYGDTNTNFASIGSVPILHTTGDEYNRCINIRKNIVAKAKKKLPRALSDTNRQRPITRRLNSFDQQQIDDSMNNVDGTASSTSGKKSRGIFKNVNRLRWGRNDRQTRASQEQQQDVNRPLHSQTTTTGLAELGMPTDAISLVLMPTQIFIIPPKQPRTTRRPLSASNSDRLTGDENSTQSVPNTPLNDPTSSSSDNKLSVIRTIPSVRISPPQPIIDSILDWDEEDRHFGRRPTFIRHRQQKQFHEKLARIQEGVVQQTIPAVTAIISAPIVELPGAQSTTNAIDHVAATVTTSTAIKREGSPGEGEPQGQTLLHLAARLGHEDIMRLLISETSQASTLLNTRGQTPLLCAIEAGSTSTATLLMEQDPLSLTCKDTIGSSVFHYATEQCNDIVLSRAISLLKRLSSSAARMTALQRLVEKNTNNKTPFVIAIEKGSLKCIKYILSSKWLHRNVDISDFINADSLKTTIDKDQLDIVSFFVSDTRRFAAIIRIQIDVNGRAYNVLEYSIALKKPDFVRTFISVRIPGDERELYRSYKSFLKHYNVPYSGSTYDQTPVQRMLTMTEMIPLVPVLLEQFVGEDGIDLSVIDDCLRARPSANRCIFGRSKRFSTSNWLKQHPLSLIAEANHAPVYDHDVVKICVDLKFQLFGNFLYLLILCAQIFFVCLYTGVAIASPTPPRSYYDSINITCKQLCESLTKDPIDPLPGNILLRFLRALLLLCSGLAILKEFIQLITQREKYFRGFFVNFLELHTYICAILFAIDFNQCTQRTGLRCKWQWEAGGLGMASVWTLLLLVFMNALKIGKYGLLFVSVFLTFLKFCLIYVFIWIGYIIAFHMLFVHKKPQFTSIFYSIPKTLAMLTGEYDFDDLFFPGGKVLQGSEAAMVLYSIFVFTMNIVIMNIMVGLAVSDVKRFRLNAKREHLRARIETCLGLQAKFGLLCETCSRLVLTMAKHSFFPRFQRHVTQIHGIKKYYLWKLELRTPRVDLPQSTIVLPFRNLNNHQIQSNIPPIRNSKHTSREHVTCEVGYYRHHIDRAGEPLLQENDTTRLMRKTDELRDVYEKANARIHNELRKLTLSLQADFDEIKRNLLES